MRAVLVTLHVTALFLSSVPSPEGGMNRKNWKEATVQAEFTLWAARFSMTPAEFETQAWAFASAYQGGLDVLLGPVRVWEGWLGTEQSWKMFVAPHRFPARLQIQGRVGADWETVFEERSETARWQAGAFGSERLRSAIFRWSWPGYSKSWHVACEAIAARLLAERPELDAARCRFHRARSPSPEQVLGGEIPAGEWIVPWVVNR